jgi:predicted metal-dependent peptidase
MEKLIFDKVTKAKMALIYDQPFFATVALSLKYIVNNNIETASTDGFSVFYNEKFFESLTPAEAKGVLAHEVMHVANLHHTRRAHRDIKKWNKACDYAINQMLIDSGFVLPDGVLIDKRFVNMSAEDIYAQLPNEPNGQGNGNNGTGQGNDPGQCGGVQDAPAETQTEMQQRETETKQLIAQAAQAAQAQGKLPAHLKRFIDEMLEPVVSWVDVLNNFITEIARNDYSFKMPNNRYIAQNLYMPTLRNVEKGKFVLMVDTSGSINETLLNKFAAEMQNILTDVAHTISVMYIDSELYEQHIQEFESDDELKLTPQGGGGTDFKPGFEYLQKELIECAAVVYFTDGYCNSFPDTPDAPVLWAVHNNKKFAPPFGEIVHINE